MRNYLLFIFLAALTFMLHSCSTASGGAGTYGSPNMGGPSAEVRAAEIASEPTGNFYYGRRYFVKKTRFWGYLRKPRQSADTAKLVIFNESKNATRIVYPRQDRQVSAMALTKTTNTKSTGITLETRSTR